NEAATQQPAAPAVAPAAPPSFAPSSSPPRAPRESRGRGGRGGGRGAGGGGRRGERGGGGGRRRPPRDEEFDDLPFDAAPVELPEQGAESDAAKEVRGWCEQVVSLAKFDLVVRTEENETQIIVKLYGRDAS